VAYLRCFTGKIATLAAKNDEIIPLPHALHLFNSLFKKKRLWVIEGATHNDWAAWIREAI